jgi:holin-like protein
MLYAFAGLLVLQLIGEALAQSLSLPLPGPLIGMLLLFGFLLQRGSVPAALQECTNGLLRNLMLLFIPAVTGVMLYFERVGQEWHAIFGASIAGAAVTMVVTVFTLRLMLRLTGGAQGEQQ